MIDSGIQGDHPHFKAFRNLDLEPPLRHMSFVAGETDPLVDPAAKTDKTSDRNAILLGCGFLVALTIGVVKVSGAMVDGGSSSSKATDNGTSIMYSSPAPVVDQNADRRYAFRKYWNTVANTVRTCGYAIGFAQASAEAQNDDWS